MDLKLQPEGLRLDIGKSFLGTVGWIRINCGGCGIAIIVPNKIDGSHKQLPEEP